MNEARISMASMTRVFAISAVIMWTPRILDVVAFSRALGIPLDDERHEDEPAHFACEIGTTHFAVFEGSAGECNQRGATQIGLAVDDVDEAFKTARDLGAAITWEPRDRPWERATLVYDPDGRAVELNFASNDHSD